MFTEILLIMVMKTNKYLYFRCTKEASCWMLLSVDGLSYSFLWALLSSFQCPWGICPSQSSTAWGNAYTNRILHQILWNHVTWICFGGHRCFLISLQQEHISYMAETRIWSSTLLSCMTSESSLPCLPSGCQLSHLCMCQGWQLIFQDLTVTVTL